MQTLLQPKLETITLYYREGTSDKIYQCSIESQGDLFVVNFAYGRRGSTLNTGTKTSSPVDYDEAKAVYDKLVEEKKNHPKTPYTEGENGTPYTSNNVTNKYPGCFLNCSTRLTKRPLIFCCTIRTGVCRKSWMVGICSSVNREP